MSNEASVAEWTTDDLTANEQSLARRGLWRDACQRMRRDRMALLGMAIVVALVLFAVLAPWLAPYDPVAQHRDGLESGHPVGPGASFPLGTDNLGRDVFSRLAWGARISLTVGILANALSVLIGTCLGATAGLVGGVVETLIMRFTDVIMGFPVFLLAVALVTVLEPGLGTIILVIGLVYWTYLARIIYGRTKVLSETEFVLAARSIGGSNFHILIRHIVPQVVSVMIVYMTLGIGSAVILESTLSFVGIGIQPPAPSWGNMMSGGQQYYRTAPWMIIWPGVAITLTVLGFNLFGDGLRDALDPQQPRGTR
jgi:peptide/nickel transport system permease protein